MQAWETRNGTLQLHDVAPPQPTSTTTVVHTTHLGICGSDWPKLTNPSQFTLPDPWRPGHEIAGTDTHGGPVAVDPLIPCSDCRPCRTGDTHLCPALQRIGWDLPGGFTDHVAAPQANLHLLPPGLSPPAAVLTDPAAVAIHGLRCHPTGPPGHLAIVGAGPIGILTALYAAEKGWETTIVHRADNRPSAETTSTTPARFSSTADPPPERAFDVVVDAATGATAAPLAHALQLVRDAGTVIVQNAYDPDIVLPTPLRDVFRRSVRLVGSYSHCRRHDPTDFTLALHLLARNTTTALATVDNVGHLHNLASVLGQPRRTSTRSVLTTDSQTH